MPDNKFIKIFLASSSELKDDREQFEIFINRKNKEYIQKNIFLELVLWEDFLDVMSPTRLQDEYNKAIANCDVFVSLFYTKVGQYTEEEFLKALETFKANKRPLIYTYFKDSPINLSEIDAEINSLLNFKKKLSTLGHFYRTYNDINHLKELFNEQLPKLMEKFKKVASNAGLNQASAAQLSKNAGKSIYIGFRTAIPDYNDFQGREQELEELENKLQQSRVIAICGNPGIGKTYLAAKLAQRLSKCYQVCWIDKDELTLDELFLEINDFLQENNEQGFITTYSKEKEDGLTIPIESKISALIHVIQGSLATKFAFFIQTVPKYLKDFIERFRTSKGDSRLIIIDRYLEESLGLMLFDKLGKLEVKEYSHDDAVNRISYQLSNQSKIQCSSEEITKICEKTDNHPFAIDLVIGLIREGKINLPSELSLKEILVYDKNNEVGLCQKLFSEIKKYLNKQEKEALGHLSVFRTSVNSGVREYLNISQSVWNSLLKRSFLKFIGNNQFRLTYIIATTWAISQSKEQILSSHKKAAYYYCTLGQDSLEKFQKLDQKAYLESYYHWRQIEKNSQEDVEKKEAIRQSAMVLNDLINQIHQVERLPSERLPGVEEWLFTLDNALLSKTPWVLLEKGRKLEKRGDYGKAKEIFTQATQIFSNNNNGEFGYSIALYYVGKMLYLLQQYQRAIEKLGKVWEIANHRADSSMEIRTLAKISSCNIELGQEIEAENAAKTAERIARETEDLLGLALILYRQGSIKRHQGYFRDAEDLFTASAKQFHELGDRYKEAKSLVRLGICQKFQGKYESAKSNLTKAISIKESINDWHGIARDKDYLGDIYRDLGKYDKAEKLYQESLEIKEGNDKIERDNYGIIKAYNNLARMALLTHQVNKCKAWVTKSEALIREHSEYIAGLDGSRLMIQGDLYSIQGNYESALKSYNRSAQCFQAPNPKVPHSYARNILNLGQTYLILGKFEDSLKYLNQTAKLFEDYKMIKYQCLSLTYLSIIKSLMLLIDEAITCNHQARQIADEDIKGDSKMLSITCLESQGFIEKIKILTNLSDEDNIEKLLTPVDSNYEEALNLCQKLCHNKNNTYYRLKSKKYFWHFIIKYFFKNPISQDKMYGLLKSELIPKHIIETELIETKYLLLNLKDIPDTLAQKIAEIALNILSPIAIRFGFNNLKEELESHAFAFLYPNEYQEILSWLDDKYPQRQQLIEELTEDLKIDLEDENLLQNIKIYPREKSIYSIYKKKQARNVSLNNILDVIGFRLITKTKEDCYAALAVVQNIGTYFKGEGVLKEAVRDYIDAPKKSTGYQSIHINIHYEYQNLKCIVEFQIRTEGMHLAAEYGIEAFGLGSVSHLQYKEPEHYAHPSSKKNYELRERATSEKKLIIKCSIESLKSLEKFLKDSQLEFLSLDDIDKTSDDLVFLKIGVIPKDESTSTDSYSLISQLHKAIGDKINLFSTILISDPSNKEESSNKEEEDNVLKTRLGLSLEEKAILIKELSSLPSESTSDIYVITPKGDILKLPNGSCCIDFAYAIHSDLGDSCSGAKVNEQIVKLETKLNNGDRVEITRQNNSFPSKDWLSFVKTSKAKHRIKRWLKRSKWSEHIAKGRELLRDKLKFNEKIDLTLDSQEMLRIAEKFNYRDMNSLFAALSYGEKTVDEILSKIRECYPKKTKSSTQKKLKEEKSQSNQQNQLIIEGQQNQLIIEGHTRIEYRLAKCCCPTIGQSIIGIIPQRSRWISVHTKECKNWQHVPESRQIKVWWHSIQMTLKTHDEIGVLGQLGLIAEKANINLQQGSFITHLDNTATFNISIQYNNNKQFETFKREIESMEKYISMDSKPAISLKTSTTSTPR